MVEKNKPTEKVVDNSNCEGADWAYYHLIAIEYAEAKLEAAKIKLKNELTNKSNIDPNKYARAYNYLMAISDASQNLIRQHVIQAKQHIETLVPAEKIKKIEQRRKKENKSLERLFIHKPDLPYPIEFKPADEIGGVK